LGPNFKSNPNNFAAFHLGVTNIIRHGSTQALVTTLSTSSKGGFAHKNLSSFASLPQLAGHVSGLLLIAMIGEKIDNNLGGVSFTFPEDPWSKVWVKFIAITIESGFARPE
jgi:hypothetical protein